MTPESGSSRENGDALQAGTPLDSGPHHLSAHRMGIDARHEHVAYLRQDNPASLAEGFRALGNVLLQHRGREVVASLHFVENSLLEREQVGLSEAAWQWLGCEDGDLIPVDHVPILASSAGFRAKLFGQRLSSDQIQAIVQDIVAARYSTLQLASFVTACARDGLNLEETLGLTKAMVSTGQRIDWGPGIVADKHCVGGLPGNRTTPIVVAICAAAGLRIPKTSSRAITSPAGTADTMETLTRVDLGPAEMEQVVLSEGGCLVWGGSVNLSPADDLILRVERALDIDSPGQLVASVLSKKIAAGSTHVLIDMPVGPSAKIRDDAAARSLQTMFEAVAKAMGLQIRVVRTDGLQPVGRGIGPALEARDVLQVLRGEPMAPNDLRKRALDLAGPLLEMGGAAAANEGRDKASKLLASGAAWKKFQAICQAQGGLKTPPVAKHQHEIKAAAAGIVTGIHNHRLARIARMAGAPDDPTAGLDLQVRLGSNVHAGSILYTVHADSMGALAYAVNHLVATGSAIEINDAPAIVAE